MSDVRPEFPRVVYDNGAKVRLVAADPPGDPWWAKLPPSPPAAKADNLARVVTTNVEQAWHGLDIAVQAVAQGHLRQAAGAVKIAAGCLAMALGAAVLRAALRREGR